MQCDRWVVERLGEMAQTACGGMTMAELIDKCEVVSKLFKIQNNYTFFKNEWDAERLYREIAKLEIEVGKTRGLEVVLCKNCANHYAISCSDGMVWCKTMCRYMKEDGFCSLGERKRHE